jgi:hypothetical protein
MAPRHQARRSVLNINLLDLPRQPNTARIVVLMNCGDTSAAQHLGGGNRGTLKS